MANIDETAVFIIHAIKQFCFGFEMMDNLADKYVNGSAGKAFFMSSIYQQLSIFYLIDKKNNPMGGAFFSELKNHGLEHLLDPIKDLFDTHLGNITFGEVVRIFRNKAIVHPSYRDSDLNRIYSQLDMTKPEIQIRWQELLFRSYTETKLLGINLAKAINRPLSDFGIYERSG